MLAEKGSEPVINHSVSSSVDEHEIDLLDLIKEVWRSKYLIIIVTFFFAITSLYYALSLPNQYRSNALLAPASNSSGGSLSGLTGQLGGLASLAGVNLSGGGGGVDKTAISIEIIKSWGFVEKFIQRHSIDVELFASRGWDKPTNSLILDKSILNEELTGWINASKTPSSWQLYQTFMKGLSIGQDRNSGLVTLSIEHYSPYLAQKWTELLVKDINDYMQKRDSEEALRSVEYFKKQIEKTDIAEMRAIFYELIEQQTKSLMLAEVSSEYVFKVISSAKVSEVKSKPNRLAIIMLSACLGLILSLSFISVRFFIKN